MNDKKMDKPKIKRILLVSYYFPTRAHAGGLRILDMYSKIKEQSPDTIIDLFSFERPEIDWKIDTAENIFDTIYKAKTEDLSLSEFLKLRKDDISYHVVDIQFHQGGEHISDYKTISDKVLFTPMECLSKCFYLNLRPTTFLKSKPSMANLKNQWQMAREEINYSRNADATICVSKSDASFLKRVAMGQGNIQSLETGISRIEFPKAFSRNFKTIPFEKRGLDVLYVAYFGSHTNLTALRWFLDNVHPTIKAAVDGYRLNVVGRGDLSMFLQNKDQSVNLVGEVKSLEPHIQKARLGIAPALSGSGFRGKINQYGVYGLPSVASNLAVKGLAYTHELDILTAKTAEKFAQGCIRLLTDQTLNEKLGKRARQRCLENYTWQSKWPQMADIFDLAVK